MKVLTHFALWSMGLAAAETQTSIAERNCLARWAAGRKRLVEIGVWHGVTTCRLRQNMADDGLLLAVDPYPIGRLGVSLQLLIAHRTVRQITNGAVRWVRKTGVEAGRAYVSAGEPAVDFLFIDGDHSYEGLRADWRAWTPLVGAGGIVALHDSCSSQVRQIDNAGSARFTREVVLADPRFSVSEVVDTLTVLQRAETAIPT